MSFRMIYHQFCIIPITERLQKIITDFPGANDANGILTYGYYDRDAGLTLEVLATANVQDEDNITYNETSLEKRVFIRMESVADEDILPLTDLNGKLAKRYTEKIKILHIYDANKKIEKTRGRVILDTCRNDYYIDDILVYLIKDGNQPEGCWVRVNDYDKPAFLGILLNEPDQDFGCHEGEEIVFFAGELEEDRIICFSDFNGVS